MLSFMPIRPNLCALVGYTWTDSQTNKPSRLLIWMNYFLFQMALAKPQLRNLFVSSGKKHVAIGCILGLVAGASYHFLVSIPRQKRYEEFFA